MPFTPGLNMQLASDGTGEGEAGTPDPATALADLATLYRNFPIRDGVGTHRDNWQNMGTFSCSLALDSGTARETVYAGELRSQRNYVLTLAASDSLQPEASDLVEVNGYIHEILGLERGTSSETKRSLRLLRIEGARAPV